MTIVDLSKELLSNDIFDNMRVPEMGRPESVNSGRKKDSLAESCNNGVLTPTIIANPSNLCNTIGGFMSSSSFFKLVKSIHESSAWIGAKLKYRAFFYELAARAVWQEVEFKWDGHTINLKPGQYCCSERRMAEKFSPEGLRGKAKEDKFSKDDIRGAIKYFCKCGFLHQEIHHNVCVLTICEPTIYEQNYKSNPPDNQPEIHQKSTTNIDDIDDIRLKETIDREPLPSSSDFDSPLLKKEKKKEESIVPIQKKIPKPPSDDFKIIWGYLFENQMTYGQTGNVKCVTDKDLKTWLNNHKAQVVFETIKRVQKAEVSRSYPAYINRLLSQKILEKEEKSKSGKSLVENSVKKNNMTWIEILEDYYTDPVLDEKIYYHLPPETLTNLLKKSYEKNQILKKKKKEEEDFFKKALEEQFGKS